MKTMKILNAILFLIFIFITNIHPYAQTTPEGHSEMEEYSKLAGAIVFLLVAFLFILFFILSSPKYEYSYERRKERYSLLARIWKAINRDVPIENEKDIMLDHEYDGIRELNNTVPPWFNALFYGTILIAAIYLIDYHVLGSGNVMIDEYVQEITVAKEKRDELIRTGAFINENNVTLLTDAGAIDNGKKIFSTNCTPCHGLDAGGTVGPNLTDQNWIHGGGIKNVFTTIKNGVPVKGMISWQTMLTPKQMQEVASYVLSLQGTKPPAGKPPEGNIWVDSVKTGGDSLKTVDSGKVKIDSVKIRTDSIKTKSDSVKMKKDSVKIK